MRSLQILVYPAPDPPHQWMGHCIELDVVSQGNGPLEAMEMVIEAIDLLAQDNAAAGRPEFVYRDAPGHMTQQYALDEHRVIRIQAPLRQF